MLVAVGSVKGSPGVTTSLAALAAAWPEGRRLLLAELDPAGGDLGVRFALAEEPSLVTLAAAGRRELDPDTLLDHTQALPAAPGRPEQERVALLAPASSERTTAALGALRGRLPRVLAELESHDVLVDCGRLDLGSAALDALPVADAVLVLCRPTVGDVHHLAARLPGLGRPVEVVVVGDRPYPPEEVAGVLEVPLAGVLPHDARAASTLAGLSLDSPRALRRSALLRAARDMGELLVARFGGANGDVSLGTVA